MTQTLIKKLTTRDFAGSNVSTTPRHIWSHSGMSVKPDVTITVCTKHTGLWKHSTSKNTWERGEVSPGPEALQKKSQDTDTVEDGVPPDRWGWQFHPTRRFCEVWRPRIPVELVWHSHHNTIRGGNMAFYLSMAVKYLLYYYNYDLRKVHFS